MNYDAAPLLPYSVQALIVLHVVLAVCCVVYAVRAWRRGQMRGLGVLLVAVSTLVFVIGPVAAASAMYLGRRSAS